MSGTRDISRRTMLRLMSATAVAARSAHASLTTADADEQFEQRFGDAFLQQYWRRNSDMAVSVGYYRAADQLTVPNAQYRRDYVRFLSDAVRALQAIPNQTLSDRNRTDWAVLDSQLRYERWSLTSLREWQWNPAQYNIAAAFALIFNTSYAPLKQRLRSALARLRHVPAYYDAARQAIRRPTREHTVLGIEQNQGALDLFGAELQRQIDGADLTTDERALFAQRLDGARAAIAGYVVWLKNLDATQARTDARSFRIGKALYDQKFLYVHQSGEDAESLYGRALQEKQAVLARMASLADQLWQQYFPGTDAPEDRFDKIGRLIGKLSANHVAPPDYMASIERLIPVLTQWVMTHDLIDLDPSKPLQLRATPLYERGVAIAGIEAPGPYDPGASTYFNVDPLDQDKPAQNESLLREYNNWMLPVFIIHEAIPGHYVQLLYANRSPSRIKSIFGNGAMIEGWAVYCERMMLESGYGNNAPEQWLIYWKWYLRSVSNTILDYGVHVQGMTEAQARTLLMREAFQSEQEVAAKWQRVQRSSVQLTQYFSGFSAIYRLREKLMRAQGHGFDLKLFHQQFLSYGSAPVALIASLMFPEARD